MQVALLASTASRPVAAPTPAWATGYYLYGANRSLRASNNIFRGRTPVPVRPSAEEASLSYSYVTTGRNYEQAIRRKVAERLLETAS